MKDDSHIECSQNENWNGLHAWKSLIISRALRVGANRGFQKWVGNRDNTENFSGATASICAFFSVIQNSSKVTFMTSSIFHVDVLYHHLIKSLLLEIYGLLFFSRYDARSQMFAFAEKLYAAWLKDNTGNINQFLTFCGVRRFLLLHHG